MGMDMYIEKVRPVDPWDKDGLEERVQLCYWRKFWDLHHELGLYGFFDCGNDVPMTKRDVERCLQYVTHHPDYFESFQTVESVCELLYSYDDLKSEGWEIVYNADW